MMLNDANLKCLVINNNPRDKCWTTSFSNSKQASIRTRRLIVRLPLLGIKNLGILLTDTIRLFSHRFFNYSKFEANLFFYVTKFIRLISAVIESLFSFILLNQLLSLLFGELHLELQLINIKYVNFCSLISVFGIRNCY